MRIKSLLFIGILLVVSSTVKAQNEVIITSRGGGGGFNIGYGYMDISDLDVFFPSQTQQLKNNQLLLGGTGFGFVHRFIMGGSGMGIMGEEILNDTTRISLNGGVGTGIATKNRTKS